MKKTFTLRTVLTVTTDKLLTKPKGDDDNGIGDLYEILNHITQGNLFTHQLGSASEKCKPFILDSFPELKSKELEKNIEDFIDVLSDNPYSDKFFESLVFKGLCKSEYEIGQLSDYEHKEPVSDLVDMLNTKSTSNPKHK